MERGPVIGIHGIGNLRADRSAEDAARDLGVRWTNALRRGLAAAPEVAVAYYAHLLAREQAQGADDPAHLTTLEQEMLLAWAAALGAPSEVAQGRLTQPARAAADWIARRFALDRGLVHRLVTVFCREVQCYFASPERRDAVRAVVADTVAARGARVVIAHSLGSVVAYEALWARPQREIDLLVTLGSPLAVPGIVRDRLDPAPVDGWGARPPGVRRWVNIADPGDVVAVPRGLAGHFGGVDADVTATAGHVNPHAVTGYLATAAMADALRGASRDGSDAADRGV